MYIPKPYREDDTATLVEFMRANSFATLVSVLDGQLWASHLPLVVAYQDGVVTLSGHLAKPNPHWHGFDAADIDGEEVGPASPGRGQRARVNDHILADTGGHHR